MRWFQRIRSFLGEVRSELKRTSWPSRKEVRGTTTVVVVTVGIFGVFLWIVDTALFHIVDFIFDVAG
jgi:preprotein translocase subunit SecE